MTKRGSLNVGLRVEMGFALLAYIINHALGGKAKMDTFMPNVVRQVATVIDEEDLPEASVEDFVKLMGARPKGD